MKKTIITYLFFVLTLKLIAQQNLVLNPSFESNLTCPSSFSQSSLCIGWQSFRSSPDYYNQCAIYSSGVSVPKNDAGYQVAAEGNGYMGLIAYSSVSESDFECIGGQLLNPLVVGSEYFVSFKTCLSSKDPVWCNTASNHLGVTFSKNSFSISNPKPLNNTAKVFSSNIIQDTLNWIQISGSFIADSAYNYIIIGNFFNTINTNITTFLSGPPYGSYYFIDDVKLSTDSIFTVGLDNLLNTALSISIFPNPFMDLLVIKQPFINVKIEIYSFFGNKILTREFFENDLIEIKTLDFPNGFYLVVLEDLDTKKIITKHKIYKQ
ncbi:MAG: T9SS type A sorting domain-containing protein [Bacteroidia bacterium]